MEGIKVLKENRSKSGLHFGLVRKKPVTVHSAGMQIHASADGQIKYIKVPPDRGRSAVVLGVYDCAEFHQRLKNAFACAKRRFSAVWEMHARNVKKACLNAVGTAGLAYFTGNL